MKLDRPALEEIENLVAEGDLDPAARIAHAAELVALRRMHAVARKEHRGSLRFIRALESLPGVADVAAWKKRIAEARAAIAVATAGAVDLVTKGRA